MRNFFEYFTTYFPHNETYKTKFLRQVFTSHLQNLFILPFKLGSLFTKPVNINFDLVEGTDGDGRSDKKNQTDKFTALELVRINMTVHFFSF